MTNIHAVFRPIFLCGRRESNVDASHHQIRPIAIKIKNSSTLLMHTLCRTGNDSFRQHRWVPMCIIYQQGLHKNLACLHKCISLLLASCKQKKSWCLIFLFLFCSALFFSPLDPLTIWLIYWVYALRGSGISETFSVFSRFLNCEFV